MLLTLTVVDNSLTVPATEIWGVFTRRPGAGDVIVTAGFVVSRFTYQSSDEALPAGSTAERVMVFRPDCKVSGWAKACSLVKEACEPLMVSVAVSSRDPVSTMSAVPA